jgi:gluconate 2-dehydrogenase gamma chain
MFLNRAQYAAVEAFAARVIPTDELGPGAREARVARYIDRLLAGFRQDLQRTYAAGLRELDVLARERGATAFATLGDNGQDDLLELCFGDHAPADLRAFAEQLRGHTIEGFFCDPLYGGNHGAVGWRLVGFPGAQWGYRDDQMGLGYDAASIPIKTLADLSAETDPWSATA